MQICSFDVLHKWKTIQLVHRIASTCMSAWAGDNPASTCSTSIDKCTVTTLLDSLQQLYLLCVNITIQLDSIRQYICASKIGNTL